MASIVAFYSLNDRSESISSDLLKSLPEPLQSDIHAIVKICPQSLPVFASLIHHYGSTTSGMPESKRRKRMDSIDLTVDNEMSLASTSHSIHSSNESPLLILQDLSLTSPFRKRLHLHVTSSSVLLIHPKSGAIESKSPLSLLRYVMCVPSPNRAKPHWTFGLLFSSATDTFELSQDTSILFGIDDQAQFKYTVPALGKETRVFSKGASTKAPLIDLLKSALDKSTEKVDYKYLEPRQNVFLSGESQKKKQPIYHVDAYLKAKEGQLYFMDEGIFYGFKKPVLFFPSNSIASMNVMGVTGRTFNLVLSLAETTSSTTSFEFAMIDNVEYDGISGYIESLFKANKRKSALKQKTESGNVVVISDGDENTGSEEEEDHDFHVDGDDDSVDEEYDSDHETDSQASSSDDQESDDGEEGSDSETSEEEDAEKSTHAEEHPVDYDDDDDVVVTGESSQLTGMQAQLAMIEQQRAKRFNTFVHKHGVSAVSESLGVDLSIDSNEAESPDHVDIDYDAVEPDEGQDVMPEEEEEDELL